MLKIAESLTWIPVAASTGAALLTGLVAVLTLLLNGRAQRRLEATKSDLQHRLDEQKAEIARRETVLAKDRETRLTFRQNAFLPFLEKLHAAIATSYPVAHLPPYFPEIGAVVPAIKIHADASALGPWYDAIEAMFERRIEVLLAANPEDAERILAALIELVNLSRSIFAKRNLVWGQSFKPKELVEAQRVFVEAGYRLMTLVTTGALNTSEHDARRGAKLDGPNLSLAIPNLAVQLEKSSLFAVPFAKQEEFAWVALWEVSTSAEWEKFITASFGGTNEQFDTVVRALATTTYQDPGVLESQMMRVNSDGLSVYCLAVRFPSDVALNSFLAERLPQLRLDQRIAWSAHRRPYELVVPSRDKESS